ncbi:MAG TPA: hypothetical protein VNY24_14930 [Candidatus Acidoferrales bacterium]|jgi:hypothetical protein|nr:hypothetical protein [Candidatus Acidoferrales bacterium]
MMAKIPCFSIAFSALIFFIGPPALRAQRTSGISGKTYAHSRSGIEEQFADILAIVRTNDEPAIHKALDELSIPDANSWIAAHFAKDHVAEEQEVYKKALPGFQSHVWWVTGNFGNKPGFALKVEESQIARPLSDIGFEGLVPRPKDVVEVENYRFVSTVADPKLGQPSWVNSFIYLDGKFRMLGGTFPFWAEGLNATGGPMSLPPEVIHGRIVQAAAFRNDTKGPGIDAIVHIQIEVGHDGKVKKMKVLSGDGEFVSDAKQYLDQGEYPKLPNDPRLANLKAIWDMEVVFFSPKTPSPANP